MTMPDCGRAWEAEAIEDGRLDGVARESFERHARGCDVCAREVTALAAIRMRAKGMPDANATPLEHRRLRSAILREANAMMVREPRPSRTYVLLAAFAIAAAGMLGIGAVRWHRAHATTVASVAAVSYEVSPEAGASFHVERAGSDVRLALEHGTIAVHVAKLLASQRFVLGLPDGELEVHGTRFVADVADGRTWSVSVSEGVVELRLAEEPVRWLRAGDRWERAPRIDANAPAMPSAVVRNGGDASSSAQRATGAPGPSARPTGARPGAAKSRASEGEAAGAGAAFAAAMSAFDAGDYGRAERLFSDFVRRFPSDARSEDAAFLRAVSRQRRGDSAGAASAAREYLDAHPNGLRRREAERLAR